MAPDAPGWLTHTSSKARVSSGVDPKVLLEEVESRLGRGFTDMGTLSRHAYSTVFSGDPGWRRRPPVPTEHSPEA